MVRRKYGVAEEEDAPLIPSWRFLLAITGMLGGFVLYSLRVNMSLAIVCMVNDTSTAFRNVSSECRLNDSDGTTNTTRRPGEFDWDRETRAFMLSSFFIGYMITQVIGGHLARRFDGKIVLSCGIAILCAATLLTPVCARTHPGLVIAMRIIAGIGSGVFFPSYFQLWVAWAPPLEKTKLVTMTVAGNNIGSVVTFSVSGLLCERGFDGGWPSIFYIFGAIGLGWVAFLLITASSTPTKHPWISERERSYIERKTVGVTGGAATAQVGATPWLRILTSIHVWPLFICQFCSGWIGYTILTSLPQYMSDVLRFNIRSNGLYNALPQLCMFMVTMIVAPIADWMLKKKFFSVTTLRKIMQSIGFLVPGALAVGVGFTNCDQRALSVALITVAVGFTAFTRAGLICTLTEVAPKYSGIIMGMSNTVGNLSGILAPLAVSGLAPQGTPNQWRNVFYLGGGICLLGEIVFLLFATSETQPWALATPKETDEKVVPSVEMKDPGKPSDVENGYAYANKAYANERGI